MQPSPSTDTVKLKPVAPVSAWQQQLQPDPLSIFSILNRTHTVFGKNILSAWNVVNCQYLCTTELDLRTQIQC